MIGSKIKAARTAKGYSQEYMALFLNVTQSTYARIESNLQSPDIFKLSAIATLLGLNMAAMMEDLHLLHRKGHTQSS